METKDQKDIKDQKENSLTLAEPWPEEVDGAQLANHIRDSFERYIILPDGAASAIALWVLFAHAHNLFDHSPLLGVMSPVLGCGKTTLLRVLSYLTPKPVFASNFSKAVIFRIVDRDGPTMLIDEADTFVARDPELVGILNSGHTREAAKVIRCEGENYEPKIYNTWSPKVVAKIGPLPPTLESRAIIIPLRRKLPTETAKQIRPADKEVLHRLNRMAVRWAADHSERLSESSPQMPPWLENRDADNWRPLLSVADVLGGGWGEEARRCAELLGDDAKPSGPENVRLLRDIAVVLGKDEKITSKDLCQRLSELEESEWGELNGRRGILPIRLSAMLRPFGIFPADIWVGKAVKGYKAEFLVDAFGRYLTEEEREAREATKKLAVA
jgi:hypothetical protein